MNRFKTISFLYFLVVIHFNISCQISPSGSKRNSPKFDQQTKPISEKEFEKLRKKTEEISKLYPDSANFYAIRVMKIARTFNSNSKIAKALSTNAYVKSSQNLEDQALKLNQQSYLINNELNDQAEIAKNYLIFAGIYQNKSDYVNSTNYYLKSLKISKKEKLPSISIRCLRELSTININQGKPDLALKYGFQALAFVKKHPDDREKAKCFVNIGGSYQQLGNIGLTKKYYEDAYTLFLKIKDKQSIAWILTGLSNVYYAEDQEKALLMMLEAENIYKEIAPNNPIRISNIGNIGSVYFNFAQHFAEKNNFKNEIIPNSKEKLLAEAENYYLTAIKLSKNIPNNLYFIKQNLANLQAFEGDFKNAYTNLLESKNLEDSLFSQKNKNAIAKLESEKVVLELKTKNEKKATLIKILLASALGIFLIGFLGFRNFRNKQKLQNLKINQLEKDKQLLSINGVIQGQEEERSRIAKDLHDGLGGLLSGTKLSLTHMKENLILTEENAQQFDQSLQMLDTTIQDLRRVSHNLMPEALVKYGLIDALKDFCGNLQNSTQMEVSFLSFGEYRKLDVMQETFVYRIVQELINNAVKDAQATEIITQLTYLPNKLLVVVEDNGVGYDPVSVQDKKGAGLKNIEYRVQYLNGTLETNSSENNGTSINIELHV